jgi:hypothetical protein
MKNTVLFALMILAAAPASAQKTASPNCVVNSETTTALSNAYAARVDGLLRDAHACLRSISERVEAGSMSPEAAQKLKFAVMQDVISRLDAISAVYDVRLNEVRLNRNGPIDNQAQATVGSDCAADKVRRRPNDNATVSVEELKSEAASGFGAARRGQSAGDSNGSY